jgi:hypothetical protein
MMTRPSTALLSGTHHLSRALLLLLLLLHVRRTRSAGWSHHHLLNGQLLALGRSSTGAVATTIGATATAAATSFSSTAFVRELFGSGAGVRTFKETT